jgi:hypothetical protein
MARSNIGCGPSPGGAKDHSPRRKPWERTAVSLAPVRGVRRFWRTIFRPVPELAGNNRFPTAYAVGYSLPPSGLKMRPSVAIRSETSRCSWNRRTRHFQVGHPLPGVAFIPLKIDYSLMLTGNRPRNVCLDCYREEHLLWNSVTGKCAECRGSGVNLSLSLPEPKCRFCKGTGICPTCGGTARLYPRLSLPGDPA